MFRSSFLFLSSRQLKQNLKVKCVSCNEFLPLQYFPIADMNILKKSQNALCTCCRTLCSNCGYPLISSTGQRMNVRQKDLTLQMASLTQNQIRASKGNNNNKSSNNNSAGKQRGGGGRGISMEMSSAERANLWTMNDGTSETENRLGSRSSTNATSKS